MSKGKEGKIIQLIAAGNYLLYYYNILSHWMQQMRGTNRLFAE
jgi:hypothetical protein